MHQRIGSWKTWLFFKLRLVNPCTAVLPSKPIRVYEHHIFGFNVELILVHPFELCLPTLWMSTWYTAAISTKYLLSPCKSCRLTQDGSLFCPLCCQCSQPEKMGTQARQLLVPPEGYMTPVQSLLSPSRFCTIWIPVPIRHCVSDRRERWELDLISLSSFKCYNYEPVVISIQFGEPKNGAWCSF